MTQLSLLEQNHEQPSYHPAEAAYYSAVSVINGWHTAADAAMKYLIKKGEPFSADDLRKLLEEEPPTPNAWGGLFMAYSRRGMITRCGWGSSNQPRRNGGHRYVWQGCNKTKPTEEEQ